MLKAVELLKKLRKEGVRDETYPCPGDINLSFIPRNWISLVATKNKRTLYLHHFETCVMQMLKESLKNGDIYAEGADAYGNYRQHLLPWETCLPLLAAFCKKTNTPTTGVAAVAELKKKLTDKSPSAKNNL